MSAQRWLAEHDRAPDPHTRERISEIRSKLRRVG